MLSVSRWEDTLCIRCAEPQYKPTALHQGCSSTTERQYQMVNACLGEKHTASCELMNDRTSSVCYAPL